MRLIYNSIEIGLGPPGPGAGGAKTHHVHATPIFDATGQDYQYTRYVVDVAGWINPRSVAFSRIQPGQPIASPGTVAAVTHAAIRDALSQPRQTLLYLDNAGNILLRSPSVNPNIPVTNPPFPANLPANTPFDRDCTGGPIVLRAPEILSISGDKTMHVRVAYQTDINESFMVTNQPSVLLSNRWSSRETMDDCAFSTIVHTGTAVFRADVLSIMATANGARILFADDFRDAFAAFAIPPGFKRMQVNVDQEPDGYTVRYRVVDEQRPVTLTDFDAMDVECVTTVSVESKGLEELGEGAFGEAFDFVEDFVLKPKNWLDIFGGLAHGLGNIGKKALGAIPQRNSQVVITAKGHKNSKRQNLANLCFRVLSQLVSNFDLVVATTGARLTVDQMGKWVRLQVTILRGPLASVGIMLGQGGLLRLPVPALALTVPADDSIKDETTDAPGRWPPYPGPGEVRGTSLALLMAQILSPPYVAPTAPLAVTQAQSGLAVQ